MGKLKILLLSLVIGALASRIFMINPAIELIGDGGDKYEFFSFQYFVHENIKAGKYPLAKTDALRYPAGFELSHGYDGALATFAGALLGFIMPLPLAYNFTIVFIITLNLYLSYLLFHHLSGSGSRGFVGAIIYGLSPFVLARINAHLNLAFIGGLPFFLYTSLRLLEKVKENRSIGFWDICNIFLGILLIASGSLQYLIISFWISLIFVVCMALFSFLSVTKSVVSFQRRQESRLLTLDPRLRGDDGSLLNHVLISLFMFLGVTAFLFGGYAWGIFTGSMVYPFNYQNYVACCKPTFVDLFIPNVYAGSWWGLLNPSGFSIERVITPGIVEWGILIFLVLFERGSRVLLLSAVVYGILSLGFVHLPFWPEGGRSVVFFSLCIAWYFVQSTFSRNTVFLICILTLLVTERVFIAIHTTAPPSIEEYEVVKSQPGIGVLNVPMSKSNAVRSALPYFYNKKIVDGYIHDTADNDEADRFLRNDPFGRLFCTTTDPVDTREEFITKERNDLVSLLRASDIQTIVLHKFGVNERYFYPECEKARNWWQKLYTEQLLISEATRDIAVQTVGIAGYTNFSFDIFFQRSGVFQLQTIFISSKQLNNTKIILPDNEEINPVWLDRENAIQAGFDGPIELNVTGGEKIHIKSDQNAMDPVFVTVYFRFVPDDSSDTVQPVFQKIYSGQTMDIIHVQ